MKAVVRETATPRHRSAFRGNEQRLVTQHPRRRVLSLAAGAGGKAGSRRNGNPPVVASSNPLSTRHQRFACARLSQLTRRDIIPTLTATLTTIAFDDSSLQRFEV